MRVLVTGSSGRIGAVVAREIARTHHVIGLDRIAGPWTNVVGSIADAAVVADAVARVDAIIHTAALHAPHVGIEPDSRFVETNVHGTERLLEAALRHGLIRFVLTSSTSLYGAAMVNAGRAVWVTESLTPIARDVYDETKLAAEAACAAAARAGLPCISLRMSRCFPEPPDLMAIYRLYRGVDATDVAEAHRLALTTELAGYHAFNISAQTPFTEDELTSLYCDAAGLIRSKYRWAEAEFARRGWTLPRSIDRVYVIEKARRMLGYAPRYNFESLLA